MSAIKIGRAFASASLLTCEVLSEYLKRGLIDDQIRYLQNFYRARCASMAAALQKHFPGCVSWSIPKGGFFVWAELPENLSAKLLRALARERGADFMPGQACFIEPVADRFVRLCFAYVDENAIEAGVEIIGSCLREIAK